MTSPLRASLRGVGFLVLALLILSTQNIAVKWIGGNYSVLEIVTVRSLVALPLTLLLFRLEGGRGWPTTRQPKLEYGRGALLFLSYTTHMMGLAALPLADIESIRYSGPLAITGLSVRLLGEKVGLRRWVALGVGFAGVLLVVRPGAATFNLGSVFILASVLLYALNVILTRRLQTTDSSATMAYYSSLVYLLAALVMSPLAIGVGERPAAHPSIAFLLRTWTWPTVVDGVIMAGLGLVWAAGMYFLARAYSAAQASRVAPFEYLSLPINVVWGLIIWRELPSLATLAGALLTLLSGLVVVYPEQSPRPSLPGPAPDQLGLGKDTPPG